MLPRILVLLGSLALVAPAGCGSKSPPEQTMKQASETAPTLDSLTPGQKLAGFRAQAVYLDDTGTRIGARFAHPATGFTFDLVYIETAPQAFVWVNTFPTSDMGEPHTQEHLLLGKGNKGRYVASVEAMSLAESSAFTMQWRTCYHFHTIAGVDVFWDVLEHRLYGLLHPDYSDEEIRREVRNFGVAADPDGNLRLEEKGTVYNEMVRSYESPNRLLWRTLGHFQYGKNHPLALSSGGFPAAIREMTADDIRRFHRDNYHLGNMGMVGAFPRSVELSTVLEQVDGVLTRQAVGQPAGKIKTEADLPAPDGVPAGATAIVGYPHSNPQKPGGVALAWPPALDLPLGEELLLELFLASFAGDATTTLYKKLVDSKTRELETGATGVWSWVSSDQGQPIFLGVSNVESDHLDEAGLRSIRTLVENELRAIAALPDDSPELAAFNQRVASRITETKRGMAKFMNSPPRFGFRGTGAGWMSHLHQLAETGGFEKSLTLAPEIAWVEAELAKPGNLWRDYLARWKLTTSQPYAAASKADPALLKAETDGRTARIEAELGRLASRYGTDDPAETIAAYKKDYDAATARLEAAGVDMKLPGFIDNPPMTLDDQLSYRIVDRGGVQLVASSFESMTGATVGAAFDLRGVPETDLIYLSALAPLMTEVGLFAEGEALSHEEVSEKLREEVLSVSVHASINLQTGRAELVARGSGNDPTESARAVEWMRRFLHDADWRPENLPRIRDVVDQITKGLRNRMSGPEETWVNNPAEIYAVQTDPLFAHASSFLTRAHNLHRLRWMLREAGDIAGMKAFFSELGKLGGAGRETLGTLTDDDDGGWPKAGKGAQARYRKLEAADRKLADEALDDLGQLLSDLPDDSLAADWAYLCEQIAADLAVPPADALAGLARTRDAIVMRDGMRMFTVGSSAAVAATDAGIDQLIAGARAGKLERQRYQERPFILDRLRQRTPEAAPLFVGLVNPDTQSGVFVNAAPGVDYQARDRDQLVRYLTGNLYTGHGAHSIFMKTWSAGLAYSNGLRPSLESARLRYYAERCPTLPQTLRFVIEELGKAEPDPSLVDYAIAQAFSSRVAGSFEGRGEAMAANLADGLTPEVVKGFREGIMKLVSADRAKLTSELFTRMPEVYGAVLPGYGPKSAEVKGAVYYVIGPEKQLADYERYLKGAEGADAVLYRLYPRDYWMTRSP